LHASPIDSDDHRAQDAALPPGVSSRVRVLEAVLDSTPDLAFAFDVEGRVLYANDVLLALWGRSADAVIGVPVDDLGYEPWHADRRKREIADVVATGRPVSGIMPFRGADERTRLFEYTLHPVVEDGRVAFVAGSARDVTQRRVDEQVRLQHAQAEQDVMREADRSKDEFLATLAHELRNPLAPLRNALHVLRFSPDASTSAQLHGMMERQVDHLVRLVDDLLEVSRITRGQIELRIGRVELSDVIATALDTSRPLLDAARHTVEVTLPDSAVVLYADAVRLSQVFANLLNNAAKYTPPGGHVRVTAEREGDTLSVRVQDDGIGMDRSRIAHVFDLFTQLEEGTSRAQGGLGIGLYLVRTLVEMHGGSVTAHSDGIGTGSDFVVRLPLPSDAAGIPEAIPPLPYMSADGTPSEAAEDLIGDVLVVDDNIDAADSLATLLGLIGFNARVAHSGAAALRAMEQRVPSAVLLDIGMPGMDGFEVARRIRQRSEMSGVPIIALTGWGQESDRRRALEAGFDHHLVKPVEPARLAELLNGTNP
jgi:PAS domain S-box-containing protein